MLHHHHQELLWFTCDYIFFIPKKSASTTTPPRPASRAPLILHLDTAAREARTAADRAPSGTVKTATDAGQAQEVRLLPGGMPHRWERRGTT